MNSRHLPVDAVHEPVFRVVTPGAAELAASGELDRDTAGLMLDALGRVPLLGPGDAIALDLGDLTFIDAAGARCLLACRDIVAGHGKVLTVRNLRPAVRRVLDILGVLQVIPTSR